MWVLLSLMKTIAKIATCLELRSAALQSTQSQDEFKLEDLKKLEPRGSVHTNSSFETTLCEIIANTLDITDPFLVEAYSSVTIDIKKGKILAPGEEEHLEFEEDDEEGGAGAGSPDSFPARVPGSITSC
ncbi:hypothetical protein llap_15107 [Limosa lapponica baueri]|uniref:Axin interactor dorsalization-associated protein N-terminal domain-containing protein n=1 Tax=Limosa lapponica baueri TaxID=1758121 RepID=A0A2I0TL93_LIMLA|nr:hypothetical protein llap_15107 [Limosa lapponica baueri]